MPFNALVSAIYNREISNTNLTMGVMPSMAAAITVTSKAGAYGGMGAWATIIADNTSPTTADYWVAGLTAVNPNAAAAAYYEIEFGKGSATPATLNLITEALFMPAAFTAVGEFQAQPHYFPIPKKVVGSATSGLVARCGDSVGGKTVDVKAIYVAGLGT